MKLGTNDIGSVYLGTNAVQKVYLGTNEVWSSKPTVSDADAQAFIDRVYTAGGTLSTTEADAVNTLVIDMKADGIWTKMKAIYPMVGGGNGTTAQRTAACSQNLKSSSFTGTFTATGWTFASTGVKGNGSSAYMDTNFLPSSQFTNNDTHISYYSRTNITQSNPCAIGTSKGVSALPILTIYTSNGSAYFSDAYSYVNNRIQVNSGLSSAAFFINTRTSSTSFKFFRNNAQFGTTNTTTSSQNITTCDKNIFINALNLDGVAGQFGPNECAFASIGDGLTDTEASNFYTAVQGFNQTLNRNVGPQVVSDADAQAYINRVYNAGGTLTNTEANAVNQLTIDMKAAGIWSKMKAIYPMVGASAAACSQNLKSSSFTGTFTSGWTFASTGVTPNGTSAYMDTGINDRNVMSDSSNSLGFYSRTNNSLANCNDIGAYDGTYFTGLRFNNNGSTSFAHNGSDGQSGSLVGFTSNLSSAAFLTQSRISLTSFKFIRNGSVLATTTNTKTGINANQTFYVGATRGTSGAQQYSNREFALAYFSDGLTDGEAGLFYNAVQEFQTTLNRQV